MHHSGGGECAKGETWLVQAQVRAKHTRMEMMTIIITMHNVGLNLLCCGWSPGMCTRCDSCIWWTEDQLSSGQLQRALLRSEEKECGKFKCTLSVPYYLFHLIGSAYGMQRITIKTTRGFVGCGRHTALGNNRQSTRLVNIFYDRFGIKVNWSFKDRERGSDVKQRPLAIPARANEDESYIFSSSVVM